jgi:DnaK suppressor protein
MTEYPGAREALEAGRGRTLEMVARLEREFTGIVASADLGSTDDEHDPEGATIAFERQHVAALLSQGRDHLAEINAALRRLDEGGYGICGTCGQPMAAGRLAARPAARDCTRCAASSPPASGRRARR